MKPKKAIPKFKNEDEEREFWATHDATDYIDWDSAETVDFSHLRKNDAESGVRQACSAIESFISELERVEVADLDETSKHQRTDVLTSTFFGYRQDVRDLLFESLLQLENSLIDANEVLEVQHLFDQCFECLANEDVEGAQLLHEHIVRYLETRNIKVSDHERP